MITAYTRGHKVYYNQFDRCWRYCDNNKIIDPRRRCKKCHRKPTKNGHDACLGNIPRIYSACCGHGNSKRKFII